MTDAPCAEVRGGYGLIVHDGGESVIHISYCERLPLIADLDVESA
jgi:hypothetical protein